MQIIEEELKPVLPPYAGIAEDKICLVESKATLEFAKQELLKSDVIGFDTESKPIFTKGQSSDGPHLLQLATQTHAFLFPLISQEQIELAKEVNKMILESPTILKVGFGLGDDNQRLLKKLGIKVANVLDLSRAMGESKKKQMGAKAGIAKYFGQTLQKSKSISTSNWAAEELNKRQLKYAADDAHTALLLYTLWKSQQNQATLAKQS